LLNFSFIRSFYLYLYVIASTTQNRKNKIDY